MLIFDSYVLKLVETPRIEAHGTGLAHMIHSNSHVTVHGHVIVYNYVEF